MDSSVDTAPAGQGCIGSIDDGVGVDFGDIALLKNDAGVHIKNYKSTSELNG
jgi:hypothetical protein